jgi:hypothetical protein
MERDQVAQRIRERLRSGELPRKPHERMWGGPGSGLPCRGCGDVIRADEMEIEVQFRNPTGFTAHRLHTRCFAVWEIERHGEST